MTLVTLRPNSTITAGGSLTGGASAHAVLSDDSDASYVTLPDDVLRVGLSDLSLPAGALIKDGSIRLRLAKAAGSPIVTAYAITAGGATYLSAPVGAGFITSPTTLFVAINRDGTLTDALADGMQLLFAGIAPGSSIRLYEAYFDVVYVEQPVVEVTAPTGTVTDTNLPTVRWDDTLDPAGDDQSTVQVRIFDQATYTAFGFDPATSTAVAQIVGTTPRAWTLAEPVGDDSDPLADGTYRAYVRIAQTVDVLLWSAWDFSEFTIDVALPAVPTLTVMPDDETGSIDILATHNSGPATTSALEVQRSIDGGMTWAPMRLPTDTAGVIVATDADVIDFEAPNGTLIHYRARALHNYSGVYAASAWATATATWSSLDWWLKCPEIPVLNAIINIYTYGQIATAARSTTFMPLGAEYPIVVSDTPGPVTGSLQIHHNMQAERAAIDALLAAGRTLLLQGPPAHDEPDRYVRFGDRGRARWIDIAQEPTRIDTLPWTEVATPSGVIDAWPGGS